MDGSRPTLCMGPHPHHISPPTKRVTARRDASLGALAWLGATRITLVVVPSILVESDDFISSRPELDTANAMLGRTIIVAHDVALYEKWSRMCSLSTCSFSRMLRNMEIWRLYCDKIDISIAATTEVLFYEVPKQSPERMIFLAFQRCPFAYITS